MMAAVDVALPTTLCMPMSAFPTFSAACLAKTAFRTDANISDGVFAAIVIPSIVLRLMPPLNVSASDSFA